MFERCMALHQPAAAAAAHLGSAPHHLRHRSPAAALHPDDGAVAEDPLHGEEVAIGVPTPRVVLVVGLHGDRGCCRGDRPLCRRRRCLCSLMTAHRRPSLGKHHLSTPVASTIWEDRALRHRSSRSVDRYAALWARATAGPVRQRLSTVLAAACGRAERVRTSDLLTSRDMVDAATTQAQIAEVRRRNALPPAAAPVVRDWRRRLGS